MAKKKKTKAKARHKPKTRQQRLEDELCWYNGERIRVGDFSEGAGRPTTTYEERWQRCLGPRKPEDEQQ